MAEVGTQKGTILKRLDSIEGKFNEKTPQKDRDDINRIRQMVITGDSVEKYRLIEEALSEAPPELQSGVVFGVIDIKKQLSNPSSERFFLIWLDIFLSDRFG